MKLVIGSYILDGVSSTAYEEFITYYSQTAASYITNSDIERWNTPTDLSDYYNKSYISNIISYIEDNEKVTASAISYLTEKVGNIDIPETDLSGYATESYVMDKVNSISFDIDTTGLVNESRMQDYVTGAIAGHSSSAYTSLQNYTDQKISGLNISSYATKDWVTEHITEIASGGTITLDGYATELWVNNQGFLKQSALSSYVTQSIMSAALNSYMKKSDMTTYATKQYVDNAILQAATGEVDLSMYALKSEIPSLANYYNKQYIDNNMASKSYVTAKVVEIASGGEITLDGYATETWVSNHFLGNNALNNYYTKSQVDSKIPSLSNYITFDWIEGYYNQYVKDYCDTFNTSGENLENYVSKEELASIGYITEHQDLSSYATISYVTDEIQKGEKVTAAAVSYIYEKVNALDNAFGSIVIPEVDTSYFVTYDFLSSQSYLTEHQSLADYVTKTELSQAGYLTQHQNIDLSSYATISYVTDELVKAEKVTASAISYLSDKIDNIEIPSGGGSTPDLTNYVTKSYLDSYYLSLAGGTMTGDITFADGNAVLGDQNNLIKRAYIANLGMDFTNGIRIYDTASGNLVRLLMFNNRIAPNHNNYMSLGLSSNAWKQSYSYSLYSYTASGWLNIGDTLAGLETLLSQI